MTRNAGAVIAWGRGSPSARFLLAAFFIALALRLAVVLPTYKLGIGLDDMFQYDMLARSLASGNGFRWYAPADVDQLAPYLELDVAALDLDPRGMLTTFRAPLYPALLGISYAIFGQGTERFFPARLLQAVLGAVLVPLTYLVGRLLLFGTRLRNDSTEKAARTAAVIVAAYPILVVFPLAIATENLFFPLVLASTAVLLALSNSELTVGSATSTNGRDDILALSAGVLLGLASLTRSVILPFAVAGIFWIWWSLHRPRLAAVAGLALVLTIVPWIVRNTMVAGRLTGIETSMGYNLYLGYHPESTGAFVFGPSLDLLSILDDQVREQVGTEEALGFIRNNPARFPYLILLRLGHFSEFEWRGFIYFYSNGFLKALHPPALLLILGLLSIPFAAVSVGAVWGARELSWRPQTQLIVLLILFYLLPHALILSEERFHLVLVPLLAILAAAASLGKSQTVEVGRKPWLQIAGTALLVLNWIGQVGRLLPTLQLLLGPGGHQLHLPY